MSKHRIVIHSRTFEGNGKSGAHLATELATNDRLCEIRTSFHFSFTPAHPAVQALTKAIAIFDTAVEIEKHVREAHSDGSECPVAKIHEGKDWSEIDHLGVYCNRGE